MLPGDRSYNVPMAGEKSINRCTGLTSSVLSKTKRTGQNINTDKIARLVSSATLSGPSFYKALYKKSGGGGDKKKGPAGDRGSSARMRDGETVGEGADKIGMDNVGHRLLSKMGWAEGGRIGRSEGGLDAPYVSRLLGIYANAQDHGYRQEYEDGSGGLRERSVAWNRKCDADGCICLEMWLRASACNDGYDGDCAPVCAELCVTNNGFLGGLHPMSLHQ